jgi:ribosomal protein S18 acetylase RimI-like enzyme
MKRLSAPSDHVDRIRAVRPQDLDLLWEFLAIAAYEPDGATARQQPVVAAHLHGWPGTHDGTQDGTHDFGYIALIDDQPAGTAWVRLFSRADQPSVYFNDHTPELSIGVAESARGKGIGSRLLSALLAEAAHRRLDVCLTVRHTNPALWSYRRHGFERTPHLDALPQPRRRHFLCDAVAIYAVAICSGGTIKHAT